MIEMKHITKTYGDLTVFSDFPMEIPEGEVLCSWENWAEARPSCGCKIHFYLLRDAHGTGTARCRLHHWSGRKKISVVFQEDRLLPGFTVRQNLYSVCESALQQEHMMRILTGLGLEEWIDREVAVLSGGMQRRVAICRALLVSYIFPAR